MKQIVVRMILIVGAACLIAGVDGARRGLSMPPKVDVTRAPNLRGPVTPPVDPVRTDPTDPVEAVVTPTPEEPAGGNGFTVELFHELWATQSAVILDARMREQYVAGHIPAAWHLPVEAFNAGLPEAVLVLNDMQAADPNIQVVIYCDGGDCHASELVGSKLMQYGIEQVFVFEGGFDAWVQAGHPIEEGEPLFP